MSTLWIAILLVPCAFAQIWDGGSLEREIGKGELHRYKVQLRAGNFFHVKAEQLRSDVTLRLVEPTGKTYAEVDRLSFEGWEDLPYLVVTTGEYEVQIAANGRDAARYRLEATQRLATEVDQSWSRAFVASFVEAKSLRAQESEAGYKAAMVKYEFAVAEWRKIGNRHWEGSTLDEWALVLDQTANYAKARDLLEQALAIREVLGERNSLAVNLSGLGNIYASLGDQKKGILFTERALEIRRLAGDKKGEAIELTGLGSIYMNQANFAKAIDVMLKALAILNQLEVDRYKADLYINLAGSYYSTANYQKALEYYTEALNAGVKSKSNFQQAFANAGLGRTYHSLGDLNKSGEYLKIAEGLMRKVGQRQGLATVLYLLGTRAVTLADYTAAIPLLEESLALSRENSSETAQAIAMPGLCNALKALGQYEKARARANEGAELSRKIGASLTLGQSLLCLGRVENAQGKYDAAVKAMEEALALFQKAGMREDVGQTLLSLARIRRLQGDITGGLANLEEGTALLETMRLQIQRPDLRASYRASRGDRLDLYTEMLMHLHAKQPEGGFSERAFNLTEQWRARSLSEMLAESRTELRQELTAEQREREDAILLATSRVQRELFREKVASARQKELKESLAKSERDLDLFQTELRKSGNRYVAGQYAEVWDAKRIGREVLDKDTVLLEYAIGEKESYVWAVTEGGLSNAVLPGKKLVEEQVEAYRRQVSKPVSGLTVNQAMARADLESKKLYQMLVAPLEATLTGKKRLMIVPDGVLSYLPFEVLQSKSRLIERFSISYAPSASAVEGLRERNLNRKQPERSLLAFADPALVGSQGASAERGFSYQSLPQARLEVAGIQSLFPAAATSVFVGKEAQEQKVKTARLEDFRFVHFAAHGYFDEERPARSGIVLAQDGESGNDGFLQAAEVMRLRLNADLVTLSSCDSGLGKLLDGEGVMGLSRAFFYAGAQSLVVSLWKVNDAATSELMKRFYANLKAGLPRDEALRQAKLALMKSGNAAWRHPYFWAAFVFVGDAGKR